MVVFHSFWRPFRKLGRTVVGWVNLEESNHGTHRKHGREETPRSPPPRERPGRRLTAESAEPAAKKMRMGTDRSDDGPRKARKPRKGTDGVPPGPVPGPSPWRISFVRPGTPLSRPVFRPAFVHFVFFVVHHPIGPYIHSLVFAPAGSALTADVTLLLLREGVVAEKSRKKSDVVDPDPSSFLVCSAVRRPLERFVPRPGCVPGDERLCVRIFIAWVISVGGARRAGTSMGGGALESDRDR